MANQRNLLRPIILNVERQQITAQIVAQKQQELVQENQLVQKENQLNQNQVILTWH